MIDKKYVHMFLSNIVGDYLVGDVSSMAAGAAMALHDTVDGGDAYSKDEKLVLTILAIPFLTQIPNELNIGVLYTDILNLLKTLSPKDLLDIYEPDEVYEITLALQTIDPDGSYSKWVNKSFSLLNQ